MMELISIVIPVYNVESYLDKCIESVVNQTYQNIEIIIVDDGSTDSSSLICEKWAKKDNRIHIERKTNGGLSSARNWGIKFAKGECIAFVDSDDYISEKMIESLYRCLILTNTKISTCGYIIDNEDELSYQKYTGPQLLTSEEALLSILKGHSYFGSYAWNKLYKKQLFDDIRFPEGQYYEDINTTYKLFEAADNISIVSEGLYYYRKRINAITSLITKKKAVDQIRATDERYDYILRKYPQISEYAKNQFQNMLLRLWYQSKKASVLDCDLSKEIIKYLQKINKIPCGVKNKFLWLYIYSTNTIKFGILKKWIVD